MDLPALPAARCEPSNALDAFDGLTRHDKAARRSIDQADKAAVALRAGFHGRIDITRQLLTGTPGTEADTAAA